MKIDVLTPAIARPLLEESVSSFLRAFRDRRKYRIRWLYHLDRYPGMEEHEAEAMRLAADVSRWFEESVLMRSTKNAGHVGSICKLLRASESAVVFAEDDWLWRGRFRLAEVEAEVRRTRRSGYNFRNPAEYIGAFGCCYLARPAVDTLLRWWHFVHTERNAKQVLRQSGHHNLITPAEPLQSHSRMCRHMGPEWAEANGYAGRID